MAEDINEKVIKMFNRQEKGTISDADERIKFFAGFNYVKLKRDTNGKKFVASQLTAYAEKCHYIVSVMREVDNEVCLYNYNITSADLPKFIKAFENDTLNGTIIEIEKYIPEDLA